MGQGNLGVKTNHFYPVLSSLLKIPEKEVMRPDTCLEGRRPGPPEQSSAVRFFMDKKQPLKDMAPYAEIRMIRFVHRVDGETLHDSQHFVVDRLCTPPVSGAHHGHMLWLAMVGGPPTPKNVNIHEQLKKWCSDQDQPSTIPVLIKNHPPMSSNQLK